MASDYKSTHRYLLLSPGYQPSSKYLKYLLYLLVLLNTDVQGEYEKHECGLTISDAAPSDSGEWSCEVEEYIRSPPHLHFNTDKILFEQ
jgi:hypothetical protein